MTSMESANLLMKLSKKSKLFNMGGSILEASVLLVGVLLMRWNWTFLDLVLLGVRGFLGFGWCSFCDGLLLLVVVLVLVGSFLIFFCLRFLRNGNMMRFFCIFTCERCYIDCYLAMYGMIPKLLSLALFRDDDESVVSENCRPPCIQLVISEIQLS